MREQALENLKERLSSPRLRAPGTIITYVSTARQFLDWLGDGEEPTDRHFRRYFMHRRELGISERTLAKEFFQLKKLSLANGWPWPFTKDDVPVSEEDPAQPAHTPDEITQLIKARDQYARNECLYLAAATTWGCRREELLRLKKRDYDDESVLIRTAKHGVRVRHLLPDPLKSIFSGTRPNLHTTASLTKMYHRICERAEVRHDSGMGWHSIRRMIETTIEWALAENRLPLSLVADYMGWSKTRKGTTFSGAAMVGIYGHPEALTSDPFWVDRLINPIHPFLSSWEGDIPQAFKRME